MPDDRPDLATTHLADPDGPVARPPRSPGAAGQRAQRGERYVPGAVLAERYRIVGLLGRGGMGEVYRADDLRLGQTVALKFLPEELEQDDVRRALFLDEVRVARRISHPNVCRVHDLVEADGQHFLSMEFVDGEDLGSLLRRIGRLPEDKAVQIARQLCAGLAAAHDQGIVHRDLKPANIMIDGRGRARITDFGLARESDAIHGLEARSGTPAYMAPEQLEGREVTPRSDLYALGIVLHELFTGRRPFRATASLAESARERASRFSSSQSMEGLDLDPRIVQVIEHCLEPEPSARPESALAIAFALPGGDPLAAALAAGETPSPEMVAAASQHGRLALPAAWGSVLVCLIGLAVGLWLEHRSVLSPNGKQPLALVDRATTTLDDLGFSGEHAHRAWGYLRTEAAIERVRREPDLAGSMLDGTGPPLFTFWFREREQTALVPMSSTRARVDDPPRGGSDEAAVFLDTHGRLHGLELWSRRGGTAAEPSTVDAPAADPERWSALLERTALDPDSLRVRPPDAVPPMYATERLSWAGVYRSGEAAVVDAAARDGQPVWLRVRPRDADPEGFTDASFPAIFIILLYTLFAIILGLGLWMARSNLRNGRGDRAGATRVGLAVGGAKLLGSLAYATHSATPAEAPLIWNLLTGSFAVGLVAALFYLGLEPILRRRWPHRIVGWTRLLGSRFGDPLVGRELLVGAVGAMVFSLMPVGYGEMVRGLGLAKRRLMQAPEAAGMGIPGVLWQVTDRAAVGVLMALGFSVLLYALCRVTRSEWAGAIAFGLLLTLGLGVRDAVTEPFLLGEFLLTGVVLLPVVFLRFGLLAFATQLALGHILMLYPMTRFDTGWSMGAKPAIALLVVVVAICGAWWASRPPRHAADSA